MTDGSFDDVTARCEEMMKATPSAGGLAMLVEIYSLQNTEASKAKASALCTTLASDVDPVRHVYWAAKRDQLEIV